ncbi:ras GEF [Mrakia frigida]|uniref:Ras-GEF domain-containing protein n=1 Tax=Mrakia frigida TaxID=29902 RepID=UPI003FCC0685
MTHKSFATPQQLLSLLRDRFYLDAPEGVGEDELQRWVKEKQLPIRLKVLNVIKIWISDNHMEAGDEIVGQIEQFANGLPESLKAREGLPLIRAVQARKSGADGSTALRKLTLTQSETPPPSFLPPNRKPLKLTDLDPLELARQLTLMDAAMYNRIRPVECLQKAWSDLSDPNKAANIKAVIKHSNQVSNWVKAAILSESKSPKQRATIVKFFVSVAERCLYLHNFSTVAAIVAGLESSLILRLKRTFEILSPKTQAMFQVVSKAVDPDKNFSVYRDQLSKLNPPSVPFLGVYLTFLTFIEDGNPNFLQGETPKGEKLINFGKRMKSAGVLREMQTYQSVPYNLAPVVPIQSFVERQLKEAADRTEDELYVRSLQLEPREEAPERITRWV